MEEPGFLLRAVVWHFGSGDAFFVAYVLLFLAATLSVYGHHYTRVLLVFILAFVWMLLADAISLRAVIVLGILLLCALCWNWYRPPQRRPEPLQHWVAWTFIIFIVVGLEVASHWPLPPVAPDAKSMAVIGDSVSAGLNAVDITWPRQLAQVTGRTIFDASQQGATVKSAAGQLAKLNGRGDLLWIEIGGNDILESLPVDVYAERLETLLQSARGKYRTIVMMEIPAPPGGGAYGVTQRRLSKKYDIPLVPKRQFLWVLTSSGSTQDGVHLANAGHERMASLVQKTLGWTDAKPPGEMLRID